MTWTEESTQKLIELWNDGLSAGRISTIFDGKFTRNAIIGKIKRLEAKGDQRVIRLTRSPSLKSYIEEFEDQTSLYILQSRDESYGPVLSWQIISHEIGADYRKIKRHYNEILTELEASEI